MSTDLKKSDSLTSEEQLKKIDEVRKAISPVPEKLSGFCSDASIARYLRARNWHVKKATKMLKDTLKWRLEFKPEQIRWEDIVSEAESGKIYRSNIVDKKGRTVLIMRPSCQNTKSVAGQIKYFVYCMEKAILNLPPDQEQMVWLVDFWNFNLANVSLKAAKDTAHVLQNHYPERLGLAILYNPPRLFEQLYKLVKPFLEPKTQKKVKFVYADDPNTKKTMEELFDMDQLESAFGGNSSETFNVHKYAQTMKEDDEKMRSFLDKGHDASTSSSCNRLAQLSSPSDNCDHSEEEEEEGVNENDDRSISSSTGEGSHGLSEDPTLSVTDISLDDSGMVKT